MDTSEIMTAIQTYFDACYFNSAEKRREVFHSAAHIYRRDNDGTLIDRDREQFITSKTLETSGPQNTDFPRQDEIISIDFTGENTAVVRVKLRVKNILFTDILSFIYLDGKWTIISKLASGVPIM